MRLIDADNLDRRIYEEIPIKEFGTVKRMARIREIIAEEPTVGGWISVKERLPTSIVNKVLVWLEHEDLNGYLGFGHYEKYKGQEIWYDLEHNEAFSIRGYAVTHWMPLPEPPKEVTEG